MIQIYPGTLVRQFGGDASDIGSLVQLPYFTSGDTDGTIANPDMYYVMPVNTRLVHTLVKTDDVVEDSTNWPPQGFKLGLHVGASQVGSSLYVLEGTDTLSSSQILTISAGSRFKVQSQTDNSTSMTPNRFSWSTAFQNTDLDTAFVIPLLFDTIGGIGGGNTVPGTSLEFINIMSPQGWSSTESDHHYYCPMGGTITTFRAFLSEAWSGTDEFTFWIYKNGVAEASSALTFPSGGSNRVRSVTGLSISFAEGDTLTIGGILSADTDDHRNECASFGIGYESDIEDGYMIGGHTTAALSTTQNTWQYFQLFNGRPAQSTELNAQGPVGGTMNVKNLRVKLVTAPGASQSRSFYVRKNGASQSLSVTISGTDTSATDSVNTVSFDYGDLVSFGALVDTASCAATNATWSAVAYGARVPTGQVMVF